MIPKRSGDLSLLLMGVGLLALGLLAMKAIAFLLNGGVCNSSSSGVWLTVTESGRQRAYSLPPDHCTNLLTQDAEAIWGRACDQDRCTYEAWKIGAGHYEVKQGPDSALGFVLRIEGWGAGSRWHIARTWPKPDLAALDYSLVR